MLIELFKKYRTIAVCGNKNEAKSSLTLSEAVNLKKSYPTMPIYIYGSETALKSILEAYNINIIHNIEDVLDLKLKDCIIIIEEFADIFPNAKAEGKQQQSIKRFFNRIYHNNNWIIINTAQDKYFNSFICSLIDVFLVKQIDFDSLVNGTYLKRQVEGVANDDYRLYCKKSDYYIITKEEPTRMSSFEYNPELDSKKNKINYFDIKK